MKFIYNTYAVFAACALALSACNKADNQASVPTMTVHGDTITVDENSPVVSRIKTTKLSYSDYTPRLEVTGTVRAIPDEYAEVGMPFSGRIMRSYVKLGDHVSKNAPLFEISSTEFNELSLAYFDARQQLGLATKALDRARRMLTSGMISAREVEEATADVEIKRHALSNAAASLAVYGVNATTHKPGAGLIVRAPILGVIITEDIVPGQYLKEDAEPVITIGNLSKVWVVANVKEHDYALLDKLTAAVVKPANAANPQSFEGKVLHINDVVDADSRSIEVIVECTNHDNVLKPNMYANVTLSSEPVHAIIVPQSAVLQGEQHPFIFAELSKNRYLKVPVSVANAGLADSCVIECGLATGTPIVTAGGYYLLDAK